jgi:hypothetical protein
VRRDAALVSTVLHPMTATRWKAAREDWHLWLSLMGFESEVPFKGLSGKRRYRWDFAKGKVAVEFQGKGAGHQSYRGVERDYDKVTQGQLCGFTVIQCSAESVTDGRCQSWIEAAIQMRED